MTFLLKICGLTDRAAIDAAAHAGATHAGFMFFAKSPRHVTLDQARSLVVGIPPELTRVAVTVDAGDDEIDAAIEAVRAQALQLHGGETPERVAALKARTHLPVIKALPVKTAADIAAARAYPADIFLLDAKPPAGADRPGGHGITFDWSLLNAVRPDRPWLLSGGLDLANIAEAIAATRAPGVDLSSGVESAPGRKNPAKIKDFCAAARAAFEALTPEPVS